MSQKETTEADELDNLLSATLSAVNESPWHRHDKTGEKVKRICLTEHAIARLRAVVKERGYEPNDTLVP